MRRLRHRRSFTALAVLVAASAILADCSSAPGPPPASLGAVVTYKVPKALRQLLLTNQKGESVTLASWPGRTVLLVPFLTLCSDICPLTTGNLYQVERSLQADGAAAQVEIVELTVDPERDTPGRLAAYAKLTLASWQLVTETSQVLNSYTKFFGFYHQVVPQDNPPATDWWTERPLTYDVDHSDGFVIIDPTGTERFFTAAAPNFHGHLNPALKKFLSDLGRQHLLHPGSSSYTPTDILQALGWSIGRSLPLVG